MTARVLCTATLAFSLSACTSAPTSGPAGGGGAVGAGSGGSVGAGTGGGGVPPGAGGNTATGGGGAPASGGSGGSTSGSGGAALSGGSVGSGAGGSVTGAGGSGPGGSTVGTGGAATAMGGAGAAGSSAGTGGAASGGQGGMIAFARPLGTIPNAARPAAMTNLPRADWAKGLVSPTMDDHVQVNQSSVVNGYLVLGGQERFWIYDVANPAAPKLLAGFATPNRCATCGPKAEGEAESHTMSFARYGNKYYAVTIGGRGVNIWDITVATAPVHLTAVALQGIAYGDFTEAVWGVSWQGDHIYVGATNNGIDILDAKDPTKVAFVKRIPTSMYGGVSAGPLDAIGNVLVVTTPKDSGGVATLDISDPLNPLPLDSFIAVKSYIGQFYKRYVFLQEPVRMWDVLSDPSNIGSPTAPLGTLATEPSEYMSFSDNHMFLGLMRPNPGVLKISLADLTTPTVVNRIWGRLDRAGNDDQFVLPFGNLIAMGDDQTPYAGWVIGVHQAAPDTQAPVVDTIIPKDKATAQAITSRIGISFTDNIELATVNGASFIVRPVGGQAIAGKWGLRMGVLNFDPDQNLQPATTYEVVLPRGGLTDAVGNGIAQEFKSTFTTK